MLTLAIETSTGMMSTALFEGDTLLDAAERRIGRGHAEQLVPMIESLVGDRRPEKILVSCGPGSFTGIRVGIAAAQGLAIGWKAEIAGFSSLAVMAASYEGDEQEITVAMPGGHGELFFQHFARDPLRPLGKPQSALPEAVEAQAGATIVGTAPIASGTLDPLARHAMTLPEPLRSLDPAPLYVRLPDAKPKAA